jgi:hypothetical protein
MHLSCSPKQAPLALSLPLWSVSPHSNVNHSPHHLYSVLTAHNSSTTTPLPTIHTWIIRTKNFTMKSSDQPSLCSKILQRHNEELIPSAFDRITAGNHNLGCCNSHLLSSTRRVISDQWGYASGGSKGSGPPIQIGRRISSEAISLNHSLSLILISHP